MDLYIAGQLKLSSGKIQLRFKCFIFFISLIFKIPNWCACHHKHLLFILLNVDVKSLLDVSAKLIESVQN